MIKANNEKNEIDNRSENEIEHDRMMKEFFDKGGVIQKIPSGITGSEYYGTPAVVNKWAKKKKK
jgi:hypothetical protein